jgi:hypothetical protein
VGSKNSGKSYTLVKHLKNYEEYPIQNCDKETVPMRIILFSPTADSPYNPILRTLKDLKDEDIYTQYDDKILEDVLNDIELVKEECEERQEYIKLYKKALKLKNVNKLDADELELLEINNFMSPDELPKLRYKIPPANFIIFDDMIGDAKVFKKNGSDLVTKLTIKHRHKQISLIYTTQYLRAINPTIRKNIDLLSIFKFGDLKEVQDKIYSEVSGYVKPDVFMEMYEYATEEPRNSLTIDIHPDTAPTHHFRKNLDILLLNEDILQKNKMLLKSK